MKNKSWIMMFVVLVLGAHLVYAQEMKNEMMNNEMKGDETGDMMGSGMMDKGMMGEGMMGKGMMGKGMMQKRMMGGKMMGMCPMMQSMMERSVIATSDGGVIVIMGNKLTKYDADLNVVKEVELKMDAEGMKKMMEDMKGMCPMMGKGMMEDKSKKGESPVDPTASEGAEPAQETDHAGHHHDE